MIRLEPGDEIVAAVSQRDWVLVFTKQGGVYRVVWDEETHQLRVQKQ